MRHTIVEEEQHVGAGKDQKKEKRLRAVTLVELLYGARLIDFSMLMAADRYRTWDLEIEGASQGVGSYGDNPGGSNPSDKADRVGRWLTGYHIVGAKLVKKDEGRNFNAHDHYALATFAMCGVFTVEKKLVIDRELYRVMQLAIVKTTNIPTQAHVARIRTRYGGEKQQPPAGATVITEALRRLVLHLRYGG